MKKFLFFFFLFGFYIGQAQVTADFTATNTSGCPNPMLSILDDASSSTAGTINSWSWTVTGPVGFTPVTGTADQLTLTLSIPGFYTVELTACDNVGNCDTETKVNFIEVFEEPDFTYAFVPTSGCTPIDVFVDGSINPNCGTIGSISFDVGGGVVYTTEDFTHTFSTPGIHTNFTVVVTNSCGCTTSETLTDTIEVFSLPTADLTGNPLFSCIDPANVSFINNSIGNGPFTYEWNVSGGIASGDPNPNPNYNFSQGIYDVELIATDVNGCTDTLFETNYINVSSAIADFSSNITSVCEGNSVSFTDLSTAGASGWAWSFPGGTPATSSNQNPNVTYNTVGNYDVELIVSYPDGCSDTLLQANYITVLDNPISSFTADDSSGCEVPFIVNFTSTSTNSVNTHWQFPGGTPSTAVGVGPIAITYNSFGSYNVIVSDTSVDGCVSVQTFNNVINASPPMANFSSNPPGGGCVPVTIDFIDLSISPADPIASYTWNLPGSDILTSNLQNPTATYSTIGCYDVELIVETVSGCTDTLFLLNEICSDTMPAASFTTDLDTICYEETVTFSFTGSGADSVYYDFDDGTPVFVSTGMSVPHVYIDSAGSFNPFIIAYNNSCPSDTIDLGYPIIVQEPIAQFEDSTSCTDPFTFFFSDISEGADSLTWIFGDASVLNDTIIGNTSVSWTYSNTGNFIVTLIANNFNTGCEHRATRTVEINNHNAEFTYSDSIICAGTSINFFNTSDYQMPPNTRWDIDGDSIIDYTWSSPTGRRPHTYTLPGVYSVGMYNVAPNGCRDTLYKSNIIYVHGVTPNFLANATEGCAPFTVSFTDSSLAPLSYISSWHWDFGDSNKLDDTSNVQNPVWTYDSAGIYSVQLVVSDSLGCTDTITYNNYIKVNLPTAEFGISESYICDNQCIVLSNTSRGEGLTYNWSFQDGTPAFSTDTIPDTVCFTTEGIKDITLTITDSLGCIADSTIQLSVFNVNASFTANPAFVPCVNPPPVINFTNTSVNNVDSAASYWDFGDGTNSTVFSPSHIYTNPGTYLVYLVSQSKTGCIDTSAVDTIFIGGPWGEVNIISNPNICVEDSVIMEIRTLNAQNPYLIIGDGRSVPFTPDTTGGLDTSVNYIAVAYPQIGEYPPGLFLDDGSCSYVYNSPDSVFVDSLVMAFSDSITNYCDFSVCFTNESYSELNGDDLTSFYWDFGDSAIVNDTSVLENPCYTYSRAGFYNVTLYIQNSSGCLDSVIRTIYFPELPVASFTESDSLGCEPLFVNFTDASISDDSTTIVSWQWNLDGATTSTSQDTSFNYTTFGIYVPELIVIDNNGCMDTITDSIQVYDHPTASFVDSLACINELDELTSTSITGLDNVNPITEYYWDFDEGAGSALGTDTMQYAFTNYGIHNVELIVVDSAGCTDTTVQTVIVDSVDVGFSIDDTTGICDGTICFNDTSSSVFYGDAVTNYYWDFGDTSTLSDTSEVSNPCYQYSVQGHYTVTLYVTTSNSCIDSTVRTVYVPGNPIAAFTKSDSLGCEPLLVNYTDASVSDDSTTIVSWQWNLDGTSTSSSQDTSFNYTTFGIYVPELIVTDNNGCMDTITDTIQVYDHPTASFVDSLACINELDELTSTSITGLDNVNQITEYYWDFDEGAGSALGTDTMQYAFTNYGIHNVELIVVDSAGCTDTTIRTVIVDSVDVGFSIDDTTGICDGTICFNDTSSSVFYGDAVTNYYWDFGDTSTLSDTSEVSNPCYQYSVQGHYTVTLYVTTSNGCIDSTVRTVYVPGNPIATFTKSDSLGCEPLLVNYTDASVSDDSTTIVSWQWNLDGTSTSSSQDTSFNYTTFGIYVPELIVTDNNGCMDTITDTIQVYDHPTASFVDSLACINELDESASTSITGLDNVNPLTGFYWDFDEGAGSNLGADTMQYTFTNYGIHNVELIVVDSAGCSDTTTQIVIVDSVDVHFTLDITNVCNSIICFSDSSFSAFYGDAVTNYYWDFGDTTSVVDTSIAATPCYQYPGAGHYTVSLFVTTSNGCIDSIVRTVYVPGNPIAAFTESDSLGCEPLLVNYTDASVSDDSTTIVSWQWNLDGITTSTSQDTSFNYTTFGIYVPELIVIDNNGCTDTITDTIQVFDSPSASFIDSLACLNAQDILISTSTPGLGASNPITEYYWDFDEGVGSALGGRYHAIYIHKLWRT